MEKKTPFQLAWEVASQQDADDAAAVRAMTKAPERIVVSRAEFERLLEELEAPPKVVPRLRELLESATPFTN